jgi:hypothetical protein
MATVDVRNVPTVVEIGPDAIVAEFTETDVTAQVMVGPTVVEFSWGELIPEPGLSGGGVFQGQVYIRPDIPTLPAHSEPVDPSADYIMLWDASRDEHVKVLADLGGDEIEWATHEEVDAGAPRYKAVDPETGAYAYDRLRHPGQHQAGKGTKTVQLTDAPSISLNGHGSNVFRLTLGGNRTILPIDNPIQGQVIKLRIKQDATGGRTITWPANFRWIMDITPILSTAPNAVDIVYAAYDEVDNVWEGSFLPDFTGTGTGWGILPAGPAGPPGAPGAVGPAGPTGPAGTPEGGLTGQVLTKLSDDDYDVSWESLTGLEFGLLGDVNLTGVIDHDTVIWDTTTSRWIPVHLAISSLDDVNLAGLADGDALVWDTATSKFIPGVAGDVATDVLWNAKGDLAVGTGTDAAARLAVGADGQILAANSTAATGLEWINPPAGGGGGGGGGGGQSGCIVARAALQSFNTTAQAISWDTEIRDDENYWSAVNPTRITIPANGWYQVVATASQSGDADDLQRVYISKNGAALSNTQHKHRGGSSSTAIVVESEVVDIDYYAAGDYIEAMVQNRSGTSTCYGRLSIFRMSGPTGPQGAQGPAGVVAGESVRLQVANQDVLSSTAYVDSTNLKCPLKAGRIYWFEFWLDTHVNATPDMKHRLNFTGTVSRASYSRLGCIASTSLSFHTFSTALAVDAVDSVTSRYSTRYYGTIETTSDGELSYQFAQNTSSSAAPARLMAGSILRVLEIADDTNIDDEIAADSPRGWWKLDEASGNFADSSGNGYTLTITGAPIAQYQFRALDPRFPTRKTVAVNNGGEFNYAVSATKLGLTAPVTTFTVEVWGAFTSAGFIAGLGADGETSTANFAMQLAVGSGGGLGTFWEYGSGTNAPATPSFIGGGLDGTLHHFVQTKDAATRQVKQYIDGQLVGSQVYTAGQEHTGGASGVFSLLGNPGDATPAATGVYGGAAYYTTVLSEARIQAHARALGVYK